jgi:hypothetical protein
MAARRMGVETRNVAPIRFARKRIGSINPSGSENA